MATVSGEHSRLLHITDVMTKVLYLFDTDEDVSVLPANPNEQLRKLFFNLQVENGKHVATYCKSYVSLDIGLLKDVHRIFVAENEFMSFISIDLSQYH